MNKTELMETYTAEQLAEMVVELQNGKGNKVFKVKDNKNYQKEIDEFFRDSVDKICNDILEQKNNAMAMEFTRIIGQLLRENGALIRFSQVEIGEDIHHNIIERKYGIVFDSVDFSEHDKEFTDKIKELQSEVEKYRKAFEEAKKERDCQVAECHTKNEKARCFPLLSQLMLRKSALSGGGRAGRRGVRTRGRPAASSWPANPYP